MNKRVLNAVLFGALLASSTGTFTSCKDYDDDIKGLQEQIDKSGSTVSDLQTQLTTLKAAAAAAQATADAAKTAAAEAKTAADAAKAAGDQAAAAAAEAKIAAEEAKAAAAKAKADAIEEATKQVTALKTLMEQALAEKVDQSVFDGAILAVNAKIKAIDENLSELAGTVEGIDAKVAENASEIADAKKAIETLLAADANLQTQLDQLKAYAEATQGLAEDNQAKIEAAETEIEASKAEIAKLWKELADSNAQIASLISLTGEHTDLIAALTGRADATEAEQAKHAERIAALEKGLGLAQSDIAALTESLKNTNEAMSAMEERIDGELTEIKNRIGAIETRLTKIDGQIRDINTDLSNLHVLIVSRLTSIAFVPDYVIEGSKTIKFSSLIYDAMKEDENAEIPGIYKFSTAALSNASYRFNPASFNLANADYSYADNVVGTRSVAASKFVQIVGAPKANAVRGTVDFQLLRLNAHATQPEEGKANEIGLNATLKGKAVDAGETGVVVSDNYDTRIMDILLDKNDVRIADKYDLVEFGRQAHYATTINACAALPTKYDMPYDKVFNLKELVATCYGDRTEVYIHNEFPIADYNLSYKFSVATSAYEIETGETVTDQQDWFECNDENAGLYQAKNFNKELIGRTPIAKVELVDNAGNVVRRAFVKLNIVAEKYEDMNVGVTRSLEYECAETEAKFEISEQFIRDNVYRVITNGKETSMSHEEFWNLYDAANATVAITKNDAPFAMSSQPKIVDGETSVGVATKKITWSFSHGELGKINGKSTFVGSVTVKNKLASSEYPAKVTFSITVDVTLPSPEWAGTKNETFWENDMYLAYVSIPKADSPASECLFRTSLTQAYVAGTEKVTGLPTCTEGWYEVIATVNNGKSVNKGQVGFISGVVIDEDDITLTKNNLAVEAALNSASGLQALVARKVVLESGDVFTVNTFMVNFIRPVDLNMPGGLALTDAEDDGDVVNFQWNGLLTDWRGKAIVDKAWEIKTGIKSYWKINCAPEIKVIPAYQEVIKPASVEPEYGKVKFTTSGSTTLYKAIATYKYEKWNLWGTKEKFETFSTDDAYLTEEQAARNLEYQAKLYNAGSGYDYVCMVEGSLKYTTTVVASGTPVEYEYVKGIKYIPATYRTVPAQVVVVAHEKKDHTKKPNFDGTNYGDTNGCWTWTKKEFDASAWNPGQYWDFYGAFGNVVLDINKASTDINSNGGKLPNENINLIQDGNTLRYVNAGAKVTSPYVIYIPATIKYGWGTASATLTVTVNPIN